MLSLTRMIGETIEIGPDIRVKVVSVLGRQVKLAIDAPKDVAVHRQEVAERIRKLAAGPS